MQTQTTHQQRKHPARKAASHPRKKKAAAGSSTKETNETLDSLLKLYPHPSANTLPLLISHYSKDVFFKDPLVELYSAEELQDYYLMTFERFSDMRFVVDNICREGHQAFITWVMTATMMGRDVSVRGTTHFKFDSSSGLINYHRDYFDMSEEIYEQIPVLGFVFKGLKKVLN